MEYDFVELPYPYSRYSINPDGVVLDKQTGKYLNHKLGPNSSYISVTTWRDDNPNRSVTSHLHRLMALAFVPVPEGYITDRLQVDHIDGNKLNCSIENLEWVTQTENIRRAYATGLQNHETAVRVTTPDNKVHEFRNQRLASQFLKISPSRLNETLKSNTGKKCAGCKVEYVNKD